MRQDSGFDPGFKTPAFPKISLRKGRADKMAHRVKVLAAKSDNLSSNPGTQMLKGKN